MPQISDVLTKSKILYLNLGILCRDDHTWKKNSNALDYRKMIKPLLFFFTNQFYKTYVHKLAVSCCAVVSELAVITLLPL